MVDAYWYNCPKEGCDYYHVYASDVSAPAHVPYHVLGHGSCPGVGLEWRVDPGPEKVPTGALNVDPFDQVLSEIQDINRKKRADYAQASDPWSNFKDVGHQLGATAGTAVEAHIATKQSRLRQLLQPGREPRNESVRDTLLDRAVYSLIALALYDEGLYGEEAG